MSSSLFSQQQHEAKSPEYWKNVKKQFEVCVRVNACESLTKTVMRIACSLSQVARKVARMFVPTYEWQLVDPAMLKNFDQQRLQVNATLVAGASAGGGEA